MNKLIAKISDYSDEKLQNYFDVAPLQELHEMKLYADDKYTNTGTTSGLEDWQYDMLKEALTERDPDYVPPVGAKVRLGENRVTIPYWLGSMDKISVKSAFLYFQGEVKERIKEEIGEGASSDDIFAVIEQEWEDLGKEGQQKYEDMSTLEFQKEIATWMAGNPTNEYMIESKLDGVSCLLIVKNKKLKLYTRGDGIIGADISYLAPYFGTIPKNLKEDIAVRGELIMNEDVFKKKYASDYANPRNMVAGRLGGKTAREGLKDIEFVAYEIVGDEVMPTPSDQLTHLHHLGFTVVDHEVIKKITIVGLSEILIRFQDDSPYEIDGIIVQSNLPYERNTSGNPDYAFAYKLRIGSNMVEAYVEEVEWRVSKWGVVKPRVRITPVSLKGVTITYATGFNAKYITIHNIGPGAIINITRSGDVIPFIVDVVTEADEPQMPEFSYDWNETGVDITTEEFGETMCVKLASSFFAKLNVKHVSEKTIQKMYDHGFNSILKMISATQEELESVEGFGKRSAERVSQNIKAGLQNVSLPLVLGAAGVFGYGLGRKKVDALFDAMPDVLELSQTITPQQLKTKVVTVEGFSDKSAKKIVDNMKWAIQFVEELKPFATFITKTRVSDNLQDKKFVMSGFRDKDLEAQIVERGGKVTTSVSKNTDGLIVPSTDGKLTGKPKKAEELGVPIYSKAEFIEQFIN